MPLKGSYTVDDELDYADDASVAADESGSSGWGLPALLTGGALLGLGALSRNPGLIGRGVRAAAGPLNAARMTSMLSGMAAPKSIIGNIGATAIESAERGSMAPLKQLFSRQTGRDFMQAFRSGQQVAPNAAGAVPQNALTRWNPFGRLMGAGDVAAQNAMVRSGIPTEEAQAAVLQTPLHKGRVGELSDLLDSPVARQLVPFRRTPINQFMEGLRILKPLGQRILDPSSPERVAHPRVLGAISGIGGVHGATTAEDDYPVSIGLGVAAAGKYGLPYGLASLIGRNLAGGKKSSGLVSNVLPFSEYGIESATTRPWESFEPAGYRLLRRLSGE